MVMDAENGLETLKKLSNLNEEEGWRKMRYGTLKSQGGAHATQDSSAWPDLLWTHIIISAGKEVSSHDCQNQIV